MPRLTISILLLSMVVIGCNTAPATDSNAIAFAQTKSVTDPRIADSRETKYLTFQVQTACMDLPASFTRFPAILPSARSIAMTERVSCFLEQNDFGRASYAKRRRNRVSKLVSQRNLSASSKMPHKEAGMSNIEGRVILVTGSSRGIGAEIARLFALQGAKVAVHGRDTAALSAVQTDIERAGGTALQVVADITRFDEIEAMRRKIEQGLGPIEILVANAGGSHTRPGPLEEIDEEGWRASLDGNLTATFLTIKSILPGMKERRSGNIITISSAAARRPHPQSPIPYAAAKAGIQMLTQHLAAQVGPFGIRVNCIAPETILTERNQQRIPEQQKQALVDLHPIRRLGTPEDVARAALYLASEDAAWVTGVILDITGGAVMV